MSFKLPLLKSRGNAKNSAHVVPNLGGFKWEEVNEKRMLGEGSFDYVYTGEYKGQVVVVKKAKRQTNQRETDLFIKEIHILNELKCKNVVKVKGFCSQPLAVTLEYLYFDFQPFGIDSNFVKDIVHRDIKPANILVSNKHYYRIKVLRKLQRLFKMRE